jgi:hypothetical protein
MPVVQDFLPCQRHLKCGDGCFSGIIISTFGYGNYCDG